MSGQGQDPLNLLGTIIAGKYLIERVVGEGGFGVVYRAQHIIWKQPVAIKCFKVDALVPQALRQDLLEAFIQEGKLMTELSTRASAIVQARDVGTLSRDDGSWIPYLVLEWLEGTPLDQLLEQELAQAKPPRSLGAAVELLDGAAEALAVAHRRNVVHRDIKPANLVLVHDVQSGEQVVKVLDFGVAKIMAEHLELDKALKLTAARLTAFTPSYGAPEQFSRSYGATGPWTDVFAFALVLVEILRGGQAALPGDEFIQLAQASTDLNRRPTPRCYGLAVSDSVEAVFLKALAVQPVNRYRSVGEFWRELKAAMALPAGQWTVSAQPPSPLTDSPLGRPTADRSLMPISQSIAPWPENTQPGSPAIQTTAPMHAAPPHRSRLLWGAAIAASAAVLLGLGATYVMTRPAGSVAAQPPGDRPLAAASVPAVASAPPTCPKDMALVPGGKFFMGSDDTSYSLWTPAHKVQLSPYCIDLREVTSAQYKACSDVGECKRAHTTAQWPATASETSEAHSKKEAIYSNLCTFGRAGLETHPINCVSWDEAQNYCKVQGKRLPTEAEWEFAARGSDGRKYPWGDEEPDARHLNACGKECNRWELRQGLPLGPRMYEADDGFAATAPVGSFPAGKTQFGLEDMMGNVFEWTADWMGPYGKDETKDPGGPSQGERRVIRGGAFNGGFVLWVNPAFRYAMAPEAFTHGIGFRCAKTLGP